MEFKQIPYLSEYQVPSVIDPNYKVEATLIKYPLCAVKLQERINTLTELYETQNGGLNTFEFCGGVSGGCARTTAVMTRAKGSAGHLRVSRVDNEVGPQLDGIDEASHSQQQQHTNRLLYSKRNNDRHGTKPYDNNSRLPRLPYLSDGGALSRDRVSHFEDLEANNSNVFRSSNYDVSQDVNYTSSHDVKDNITMEQLPKELSERIAASEAALNIRPNNLSDVCQRQKDIEQALLILSRGISNCESPPTPASPVPVRHDDMTLDELDEEIWLLSAKVKKQELSNAFDKH